MNVVHTPVALRKSGKAASSRTTVVVVCGLGRSGRASWNAASQRLPSLEWPVRETSRQRLIACFASPNVEARDMRMGVAWQGPPPHTDCPFIKDIAVPVPRFILMAVDISHCMQACMHTCSITHVVLASRMIASHYHHVIYIVVANMLEQSVYTRPPLSWPNPAPVNQTTADNLLPPLLLPLAPGTPAFARQWQRSGRACS